MHWFSNDISLMCHCFLGAGVLAADRGAGLHRGVSVAGGGDGTQLRRGPEQALQQRRREL